MKTRLIDSFVIIVGGVNGIEQIYNCDDSFEEIDVYKEISATIFQELECESILLSKRFSLEIEFKGLSLIGSAGVVDNNNFYDD